MAAGGRVTLSPLASQPCFGGAFYYLFHYKILGKVDDGTTLLKTLSDYLNE